MRQIAPEPTILYDLVSRLKYKSGWFFTLEDIDRDQGSEGLTLTILIRTPDSYAPENNIHVNHRMPVPPAAFNEQSWRRWLFEQILLVEQHEAAEFFLIDGHRPYAPNHGPGNDPYTIRELNTEEAQNTRFTGDKSDVIA